MTRFNKAALISQDSALVAAGAMRVPIKSLLLALKNHTIWYFLETSQLHKQEDRSDEKTTNEKEGE